MLAERGIAATDSRAFRDVAAGQAAATVDVVTDPRDLARHVDDWQQLASRAGEDNVFYEPWHLLAALETVAVDAGTCFVFVYRERAGGRRLIGFFPFTEHAAFKRLPVRRLSLMRHIYCFLCTPLVDEADRDACLAGFAAWAAARRCLFEFGTISTELATPLAAALESANMQVHEFGRHERAFFGRHRDASQYFEKAMSKKSRKDLRRKRRRLEDFGSLEFRALRPGAPPGRWIEQFLDMERRGWKGRARTALACAEDDRRFFERVARLAHDENRLDMSGLFLDGRPIAMSCKFRARDGVFAFKIAFDERYARYSPGLLLEMLYIAEARKNGQPRWLDSCASPGHLMANRVWLDRRGIVTLTAAAGTWGRTVQRLAAVLKRGALRLRGR